MICSYDDYGVGNTVISFHAEVPCEMDFMAAHELIDDLEDSMKEKISLRSVYTYGSGGRS